MVIIKVFSTLSIENLRTSQRLGYVKYGSKDCHSLKGPKTYILLWRTNRSQQRIFWVRYRFKSPQIRKVLHNKNNMLCLTVFRLTSVLLLEAIYTTIDIFYFILSFVRYFIKVLSQRFVFSLDMFANLYGQYFFRWFCQ